MKSSYVINVFSVLIGLVLFGYAQAPADESAEIDKLKAAIVGLSIGESESALLILEELQENNVDKAKELLEINLDYAVCRLWGKYEKFDEESKRKSQNLLKSIKIYRNKHPRKTTIFASDSKHASEIEAKKECAQKILSSINF